MNETATSTDQQQDIFLPQPAEIVRTEQMTDYEKLFEIKLASGEPLGQTPGQFVEVSLPGIGEAPISVSSCSDKEETFELVVRKVGRFTTALHQVEEGTRIGIRGPFGTQFPVEDTFSGKDILFIAGGIGLVPLRSAIRYVLNRTEDYNSVTILFGAKNPSERLFVDELEEWRDRDDIVFMETVDRGNESWNGNVGVITTLIPEVNIDPSNTIAAICGPPVMYKFVMTDLFSVDLTQEQIFLSLERRMKCGVGKCGHCQVNGLYTCLDGPVFQYNEISNVPEAI